MTFIYLTKFSTFYAVNTARNFDMKVKILPGGLICHGWHNGRLKKRGILLVH